MSEDPNKQTDWSASVEESRLLQEALRNADSSAFLLLGDYVADCRPPDEAKNRPWKLSRYKVTILYALSLVVLCGLSRSFMPLVWLPLLGLVFLLDRDNAA